MHNGSFPHPLDPPRTPPYAGSQLAEAAQARCGKAGRGLARLQGAAIPDSRPATREQQQQQQQQAGRPSRGGGVGDKTSTSGVRAGGSK